MLMKGAAATALPYRFFRWYGNLIVARWVNHGLRTKKLVKDKVTQSKFGSKHSKNASNMYQDCDSAEGDVASDCALAFSTTFWPPVARGLLTANSVVASRFLARHACLVFPPLSRPVSGHRTRVRGLPRPSSGLSQKGIIHI